MKWPFFLLLCVTVSSPALASISVQASTLDIRGLIRSNCREAAHLLGQNPAFRAELKADEYGMPIAGLESIMAIKEILRNWLRLHGDVNRIVDLHRGIRPAFLQQMPNPRIYRSSGFRLAQWTELLSRCEETPPEERVKIFFSEHFLFPNPLAGTSLSSIHQQLQWIWGNTVIYEVLPQNVLDINPVFENEDAIRRIPFQFAPNFSAASTEEELRLENGWISELTSKFQAARVGVTRRDSTVENDADARLLAQAVFAAAESETPALFLTSDAGIFFPLLSYAFTNKDLGFRARRISFDRSESGKAIIEIKYSTHFKSRLYVVFIESEINPLVVHRRFFTNLLGLPE